MGLNPFKDSNLNDLQKNIKNFLKDHFDGFLVKNKRLWVQFKTKGKERITVMFIPHSEKKIINFHISIFAISIIIGVLTITVIITSVLIINHTSTIKEVSKLKKYGKNSKIQIDKYNEESGKLYEILKRFRPEVDHLYLLTPGSKMSTLQAKGGIPNSNPHNIEDSNNITPPIGILNLAEVKNELKTTKILISKIKKSIKYRKKIIRNTPSIWPVDGYIISRYGKRSSPYTFKQEFHYGIDIESFPCAEIKATAPGTVTDIKWDATLGLTISIKHKYGFNTTYSHCQRTTVEIGQKVSKGEIIGYVGKTGKTTRYLCYYQIKIGTEFVDPMPYLNRISRQ